MYYMEIRGLEKPPVDLNISEKRFVKNGVNYQVYEKH
jgi:hypothetical protein